MQVMNNADINIFQSLKRDVVHACKIIVHEKLDSGPFGNISVRIPNSNTFWVTPQGITFDQVTEDDMVCVDINGNVLHGIHEPHPGTFIHREIYRLRPDISAIVHTHSENTVIFSLLGCEIEPYTQLGASLFNDQGIYSGFSGPVRTSNEGSAIAAALSDKSIVIAKNHGVFTTSTNIRAALWDMVIVDQAAKIHLAAQQLRMFSTDKLSAADMLKSKVEVRDKQYDFMWKSYIKNIK